MIAHDARQVESAEYALRLERFQQWRKWGLQSQDELVKHRAAERALDAFDLVLFQQRFAIVCGEGTKGMVR